MSVISNPVLNRKPLQRILHRSLLQTTPIMRSTWFRIPDTLTERKVYWVYWVELLCISRRRIMSMRYIAGGFRRLLKTRQLIRPNQLITTLVLDSILFLLRFKSVLIIIVKFARGTLILLFVLKAFNGRIPNSWTRAIASQNLRFTSHITPTAACV